MRDHLAGYKVPHVIVVDTILRLPNGKLDFDTACGVLACALTAMDAT